MQYARDLSGAIFLFFLCLFAFVKLVGPLPLSINTVTTAKPDLFRVTGNGKASGTPDTAMVSFGVTKTASTVQIAQNQVNEVANKVMSGLKDLGIEEKDIQTTNYSVNPNYDYTVGKQTLNGYTVSENIDVKIKPVEKANKAVDLATAAGTNQIGGITFVLNDDTKKQLQQKATQDAIRDAKEKADMLSGASGMKLGRIADIQIGENAPVQMKYADSFVAGGGGSVQPPTELSPGENTINVSVTLGYETY